MRWSRRAKRGGDLPFPSGSGFDGDGTTFSVVLGGKFADGKGHAAVYLDYRKLEELTKGSRDYLNCAVAAGDDGAMIGAIECARR